MKTRFEAFALAGILALTVVTGGVALAGMKHGTAAPQASAPVAAQVAPAAAAPAAPHEGFDD
jgi:hypothetical protein